MTPVVVWDDSLSKLVGKAASEPSATAPGKEGDGEINEAGNDNDEGDEDDIDDDIDDEAEPDVPIDDPAFSDPLDFKYDPCDPAGIKLGKLSTNDAAHYHIIKSACMKAGWLEEWKQALNTAVIELSSTISMQSLTNRRSKAAAKRMHEELQQYVCPFTLFWHQLANGGYWHRQHRPMASMAFQ